MCQEGGQMNKEGYKDPTADLVEDAMNQKWKDIMNCLLGVVLYHGRLPEEMSWCEQYNYEVINMIKDIKVYHQSNTEAGLEVSNEAMAHFLVYVEHEHIGNTHFVKSCTVDEVQLLMIAAEINEELNALV